MSPPSTEQLLKIFDIGDVDDTVDTAAAPAKLQLDKAPAADDDDEIKPPEPFEYPLHLHDWSRSDDDRPFVPRNHLRRGILGKRWESHHDTLTIAALVEKIRSGSTKPV